MRLEQRLDIKREDGRNVNTSTRQYVRTPSIVEVAALFVADADDVGYLIFVQAV